LPLAAGLYLLTTTAWTLGERILLRRAQAARRTPRTSTGDRPAARRPRPGQRA
jgi:hypothetical protein